MARLLEDARLGWKGIVDADRRLALDDELLLFGSREAVRDEGADFEADFPRDSFPESEIDFGGSAYLAHALVP